MSRTKYDLCNIHLSRKWTRSDAISYFFTTSDGHSYFCLLCKQIRKQKPGCGNGNLIYHLNHAHHDWEEMMEREYALSVNLVDSASEQEPVYLVGNEELKAAASDTILDQDSSESLWKPVPIKPAPDDIPSSQPHASPPTLLKRKIDEMLDTPGDKIPRRARIFLTWMEWAMDANLTTDKALECYHLRLLQEGHIREKSWVLEKMMNNIQAKAKQLLPESFGIIVDHGTSGAVVAFFASFANDTAGPLFLGLTPINQLVDSSSKSLLDFLRWTLSAYEKTLDNVAVIVSAGSPAMVELASELRVILVPCAYNRLNQGMQAYLETFDPLLTKVYTFLKAFYGYRSLPDKHLLYARHEAHWSQARKVLQMYTRARASVDTTLPFDQSLSSSDESALKNLLMDLNFAVDYAADLRLGNISSDDLDSFTALNRAPDLKAFLASRLASSHVQTRSIFSGDPTENKENENRGLDLNARDEGMDQSLENHKVIPSISTIACFLERSYGYSDSFLIASAHEPLIFLKLNRHLWGDVDVANAMRKTEARRKSDLV